MPFTDATPRIWFEQAGDGEDVLLIPGLPGAAEDWEAIVPRLAADYRVTWLHPRGIGHSDTGRLPFTLTDLVSDLLAVREAAEIAESHVVGAGFGGVLAQHVALADPSRVRSLALIASWAVTDRHLRGLLGSWAWTADRAQTTREFLALIAASVYDPRLWENGTAEDAITDGVRAAPPADYQKLRAAFLAIVWTSLEHDARGALPTLEVPTLLLAGGLDAVAPEYQSRRLLDLLPQAELEVISSAGHALLHSRPDAVVATLRRFLRTPAFV